MSRIYSIEEQIQHIWAIVRLGQAALVHLQHGLVKRNEMLAVQSPYPDITSAMDDYLGLASDSLDLLAVEEAGIVWTYRERVYPQSKSMSTYFFVDVDNSSMSGHIRASYVDDLPFAGFVAGDRVSIQNAEDPANNTHRTVDALVNSGNGITFTIDLAGEDGTDETITVELLLRVVA